jgi:hypothetical protein
VIEKDLDSMTKKELVTLLHQRESRAIENRNEALEAGKALSEEVRNKLVIAERTIDRMKSDVKLARENQEKAVDRQKAAEDSLANLRRRLQDQFEVHERQTMEAITKLNAARDECNEERKARNAYFEVLKDASALMVSEGGYTPDELESLGLTSAIRDTLRRRGVVTMEAIKAAHETWLALNTEGEDPPVTSAVWDQTLQAALPHMILAMPEDDMPTAVVADAFCEVIAEVDRLAAWMNQNLNQDKLINKHPVSAAIEAMSRIQTALPELVRVFYSGKLMSILAPLAESGFVIPDRPSWRPGKVEEVWAVTLGDDPMNMSLAGIYLEEGPAQQHASMLREKEELLWKAQAWVLKKAYAEYPLNSL